MSEPRINARTPGALGCSRCDGDGYLCTVCEEPEMDCECGDEEEDAPPDVRRCACNPRPIANTTRPA